MCDASQEPVRAASPGQRHRLWKIDQRLHCSVIGTCLTLGDLRRIERRLKIEPLKNASDFQVHGNFVVWAGQPGPVAKQMHKLLDRRYAVTIRRFAGATGTEELGGLWAASLQDGDIPGPYWALLTHPDADDALSMRAFGEVHMLSHMVGAANRADIRRLMTLEDERDALAEQLGQAKRRIVERERDARRLVDQHATELRALTDRLAAAATLEQKLRRLEAELHAFASGEAYAGLQRELAQLRGDLATVELQLSEAHARIADLANDNLRLRQASECSEAACRTVAAECELIEQVLRQQFATEADEDAERPASESAALDLVGRRIVYVGGRGGIIPHLRAVVERCGGIFLHHDGGLEEQSGRLDALLGQGDVVFCPIDCVSHDACLRAKRTCRQRATTFVPLRTCSLSAFVAGLCRLTDAAVIPQAFDATSRLPNA